MPRHSLSSSHLLSLLVHASLCFLSCSVSPCSPHFAPQLQSRLQPTQRAQAETHGNEGPLPAATIESWLASPTFHDKSACSSLFTDPGSLSLSRYHVSSVLISYSFVLPCIHISWTIYFLLLASLLITSVFSPPRLLRLERRVFRSANGLQPAAAAARSPRRHQ